MPELPEAETIARQLDEALAGTSLGEVYVVRADVIHGDPRPLGPLLTGRTVHGVHRRAKRIVLCLSQATRLVFHLGMSGRLGLCEAGDPVEKHTHLRIALRGSRRELRFRDPRRFGGVWCLTEGCQQHVGPRLGQLGPEPLSLTAAQFRRIVDRPRQIKALLLDQRVVAGLGNIYCDESLHKARIHPQARGNTISREDANRLIRAIKSTLRKAIRFRGTTLLDYRQTDGTKGLFQNHHRVYHQQGQPCRNCGTFIERITAAGRSTFFCPSCQRDAPP